MKPPFILKRLVDTEVNYARRFTNVTQKPYGFIYWNEANKDSYLCNHAIITDHLGVESSLKDISFFYKSKNITPCLFPSLQEKELEILTPHLKNHGFEIEMLDHAYYVKENESSITPVSGIFFSRLVQIKDDIKELILAEKYGDWAIKYLERHVKNPGYHLIGGFVNTDLVTIASLSIFEGYSRIDDVFTFSYYRGKGYSSALLHYLVNYSKEHNDNHLYLYAHYTKAEKLYEKAGFVRQPNLKCWRALKKA